MAGFLVKLLHAGPTTQAVRTLIIATSVALRIGIGEQRPGRRQMQSCLLERRVF